MPATMAFVLRLGLALAQGPAADSRTADEALIRAVLQDVQRGLADRDGARVAAAYSLDADWTNAYGVTRHGRAEIEQFLTRMFAHAEPRFSREPEAAETSIRFLRPDVAVVRTEFQKGGPKAGGTTAPERRVHVLRVMSKQNGHWLIASELIMDARAD